MPTRFVDLSHDIEHDMITYPGLPGPTIGEHMTRQQSRSHYAPGTEFAIGRIDMVANTGTYVDAPFHRFADGADLATLPLESLAGLDGVVLRLDSQSRRAIGADDIPDDIAGMAVLIHTGWSRHWRTDAYGAGHPFVTRDAAERLRDAGVALVGIDSLNIDDTDDLSRPAHTTLLAGDIPVVEHMTGLEHLPVRGFRFFAVPAKVRRFGSFPVRAFAELAT